MSALRSALLSGLVLLGAGCETWQKIEEKIPPVEVCLVYKGNKLCAVKRDGAWLFAADLSPQERTEVEALLPKD